MEENNCIICLDKCDDKYIKYPNKLSNCGCKYNIHTECYKKWNKKKCIICNQEIKQNNEEIINNLENLQLDIIERPREINCILCNCSPPMIVGIIMVMLIVFLLTIILYYQNI